jgi:hypothetical protein
MPCSEFTNPKPPCLAGRPGSTYFHSGSGLAHHASEGAHPMFLFAVRCGPAAWRCVLPRACSIARGPAHQLLRRGRRREAQMDGAIVDHAQYIARAWSSQVQHMVTWHGERDQQGRARHAGQADNMRRRGYCSTQYLPPIEQY